MSTPRIPNGALTEIITPFKPGREIDWDAFHRLIGFQIDQGISGIVPVGTTGESSTLTEHEHDSVIRAAATAKLFVMPGCGSNSTAEALRYVRAAAAQDCPAVLLVDPYYNGPSSLEIRREYYAPIAKASPQGIAVMPYIIPGRTGGTGLLSPDLAELSREFPNICAVKEATGDFGRMKLTRKLTSTRFQIFSGDDGNALDTMADPDIKACGVISVASNIAPASVQEMCQAAIRGDLTAARMIAHKLAPLFGIITVPAPREICGVIIEDRFRNPLPIKTAMNALGLPAGPCRQPLGKMTKVGAEKVRVALEAIWTKNPEVFEPIGKFFEVDIAARLADDRMWSQLAY